ncbi:MAG: FliH/SctL family protein [Bacillota bacterium]
MSKVIKSVQVESFPPGAVWQVGAELEDRARSYLERASRRARELLARAAKECELLIEEATGAAVSLKDQARREGFGQGYEEGLEQARRAGQSLLQEARDVLEGAIALRHGLLEEAREDLVELALAVAGRILRQELSVDRGAVLEMVRGAMEAVKDETELRLHAHPAYTADLERAKKELMARVPGLRRLDVVADESLSPGCVCHGDWGAVDATLDSQLARARQQLVAIMQEEEEVATSG